jgi:hypothetical protein
LLLVRPRPWVPDMQAHQKSEQYSVLEYQSSEPRVFGVEIRPRDPNTLNGLLGGIRWVGKSEGFRKELTFLVMTLPARTESHDLDQVAVCARNEGLFDKLCLVIPPNAHRVASTIAVLQRVGIATLLGGVGKSSRFSDMSDRPINGVVIEPALVSQASGDPQAASILDAIIVLANSLGLKSFANDCASQSEFDFARSAGISYITYGRPCIDTNTFAAPGIRRGIGHGDSILSRHSRP